MNTNQKRFELPEEFVHTPADIQTVNELLRRNHKKIPKTVVNYLKAGGNVGYQIKLSTKYDDIPIKIYFYTIQPPNYLDWGYNKILECMQPMKSNPDMNPESWALGFCQSALLLLEREDAKIYNYHIDFGDTWIGRYILVIRNKETQDDQTGKPLLDVILLASSGDCPEARKL